MGSEPRALGNSRKLSSLERKHISSFRRQTRGINIFQRQTSRKLVLGALNLKRERERDCTTERGRDVSGRRGDSFTLGMLMDKTPLCIFCCSSALQEGVFPSTSFLSGANSRRALFSGLKRLLYQLKDTCSFSLPFHVAAVQRLQLLQREVESTPYLLPFPQTTCCTIKPWHKTEGTKQANTIFVGRRSP